MIATWVGIQVTNECRMVYITRFSKIYLILEVSQKSTDELGGL